MLQTALRDQLINLVGRGNALFEPSELLVYECDALTFHRHLPEMVVIPTSAEVVARIVRFACFHRIPYLPRGAGTSLAGGAVAESGGIIIELAKLNRILEINSGERYALVEPGVVNLELSRQARPHGLYFAPDPSSQGTCTIGGNISTNAGGPHCLKYGSTVGHVLALEVVTPEGELVRLGQPSGRLPGPDWVGLFTGSEGTLGIFTKAWVRLLPIPETIKTFLASFSSMAQAADAVSAVIASGVIPAALEMLDRLTIQAVEQSSIAAGYPADAEAVLLLELDGARDQVEADAAAVREVLGGQGAVEVREARDEEERARLWAGRKGAFGAFGRLAKGLYLQDTVVPRTKLTAVLRRIYSIAERHRLPVVNVFHAGDGNLHPVLLYDPDDAEEVRRVLLASEEMVKASIEAGGTLTGEHGVGLEKRDFMPYIFNDFDLNIMRRIRTLFDPEMLCNPQKVLPSTKVCMEFRQGAPCDSP